MAGPDKANIALLPLPRQPSSLPQVTDLAGPKPRQSARLTRLDRFRGDLSRRRRFRVAPRAGARELRGSFAGMARGFAGMAAL